ncbi:unnamed protein product [Bursaphelenchus xylophilus]|uniref:(pine wood nematode) hypothetical protein n=1 Tax=Bursaphelenchus xylophilus TaxID=6326 RepID=A0A7I8WP15_BURXY|nr:unnamed protein product [Bursaphelenchus xylophilus]CAG9094348.1 unnamed protein product [Bursaphelenchus xylophilus]
MGSGFEREVRVKGPSEVKVNLNLSIKIYKRYGKYEVRVTQIYCSFLTMELSDEECRMLIANRSFDRIFELYEIRPATEYDVQVIHRSVMFVICVTSCSMNAFLFYIIITQSESIRSAKGLIMFSCIYDFVFALFNMQMGSLPSSVLGIAFNYSNQLIRFEDYRIMEVLKTIAGMSFLGTWLNIPIQFLWRFHIFRYGCAPRGIYLYVLAISSSLIFIVAGTINSRAFGSATEEDRILIRRIIHAYGFKDVRLSEVTGSFNTTDRYKASNYMIKFLLFGSYSVAIAVDLIMSYYWRTQEQYTSDRTRKMFSAVKVTFRLMAVGPLLTAVLPAYLIRAFGTACTFHPWIMMTVSWLVVFQIMGLSQEECNELLANRNYDPIFEWYTANPVTAYDVQTIHKVVEALICSAGCGLNLFLLYVIVQPSERLRSVKDFLMFGCIYDILLAAVNMQMETFPYTVLGVAFSYDNIILRSSKYRVTGILKSAARTIFFGSWIIIPVQFLWRFHVFRYGCAPRGIFFYLMWIVPTIVCLTAGSLNYNMYGFSTHEERVLIQKIVFYSGFKDVALADVTGTYMSSQRYSIHNTCIKVLLGGCYVVTIVVDVAMSRYWSSHRLDAHHRTRKMFYGVKYALRVMAIGPFITGVIPAILTRYSGTACTLNPWNMMAVSWLIGCHSLFNAITTFYFIRPCRRYLLSCLKRQSTLEPFVVGTDASTEIFGNICRGRECAKCGEQPKKLLAVSRRNPISFEPSLVKRNVLRISHSPSLIQLLGHIGPAKSELKFSEVCAPY